MNPDPTRHRRPPAGFTLIEMIVVIVIMSVLAGLTLLSMNRVDPSSSNACGDRLNRWLTQVERRAAREDSVLYLDLESDQPVAARLEPEEDETTGETHWLMQRVDEIDLVDCRLKVVDIAGEEARLDALEGWQLAVTPSGDWSTAGGEAAIRVTGRDGGNRTLHPGRNHTDED